VLQTEEDSIGKVPKIRKSKFKEHEVMTSVRLINTVMGIMG
jgi:hypothetical protein